MRTILILAALVLVLAAHNALNVHATQNVLNAQAARQPVTVTTDQQNYQPGDRAFVTVHVLQAGGVNADAIWVFVTQPDNVNNYFQTLPPTGGIVNFTLAMDAPSGNYTVFAEWNYPAGGYVKTWFTVTGLPIPEFPAGFLVLLLAPTFASCTFHGWKITISSTAPRPTAQGYPRLR